jgi:hypothetical protein
LTTFLNSFLAKTPAVLRSTAGVFVGLNSGHSWDQGFYAHKQEYYFPQVAKSSNIATPSIISSSPYARLQGAELSGGSSLP